MSADQVDPSPILVPAPAKLNLTLDVLERRADGYHELRSIFVPLSLADEIAAEPAERIERGEVNGPRAADVPPPDRDLTLRAARLLHREAGLPASVGARIGVDKRIPSAAGLGGGSMDAAAALLALDRLWGLNLPRPRLARLALRLGADVPFGLLRRPALAEGVGERLTPIELARPLHVVVVKPPIVKSTGAVYARYGAIATAGAGAVAGSDPARPRTEQAVAALAKGDVEALASALGNALEPVMFGLHPELGRLRSELLGAGALAARMTGAGPSLFALARDRAHAAEIAGRLRLPGRWWSTVAEVPGGR